MNGVKGILYKSNINSNEMFIPAAGFYNFENNKNLNAEGGVSGLWSSMIYQTNNTGACVLFSSSLQLGGRNCGLPIRGVMSKNDYE